jgi:hypothetical protein
MNNLESFARQVVACDQCGAELGQHYPEGHKNISVALLSEPEANGATYKKQHEFCDMACMASFINKKMETQKSAVASYTAEAKIQTICDNCKRPIDTKDKDDKEDSIAATLKGPDGIDKQYHLHNEKCLAEFLNDRSKKKAYKSKASITDGAYYSDRGEVCLEFPIKK